MTGHSILSERRAPITPLTPLSPLSRARLATGGRAVAAVAAAVALLGLAGCGGDSTSSESSGSKAPSGSAGSGAASSGSEGKAQTGSERPACTPEKTEAPAVVPVDGVPGDYTMTSFDQTAIRLHWYPAKGVQGPAPTVLQGPGWSLPGATDTGGSGLFGDLSVSSLRSSGYNVLTWDPRGFGASTGTVMLNAPDFEGRDVQRMIDWVATQPEVRLDGPGDPRMGMVGGSYGGEIQFITAAADCRVDAIVPTIAWHSLGTSLYKSDTFKQGWTDFLYGLAAGRQLDPRLSQSITEARDTGAVSASNVAHLTSLGPGDLVGKVTVPTLIIQGTVDTLFTLDEALANYSTISKAGVPVSMLWYCGGHGVCLTEPGDAAWIGDASIAWLDRYVRGDESAPLPQGFETVDQDGTRWVARAYPAQASSRIEATGEGDLALEPSSVAGPAEAGSSSGGPVGSVALSITPAKATAALDVTVRADAAAFVLGAPTLTLSYSGTTPPGDRPVRVFAQLVDDGNGRVLGNQITPIALELDGKPHTLSLPLEAVAHRLSAGDTLTLQLVASTPAYAPPRFGGTVRFDEIGVSLPVTDTLRKA